ncbi:MULTISPECIES: anthranilate phosphoribosyltransferase [Acetobacterium]|jgi:anthranilate phosphoribosyltransferase|uniref:Anthranilate phosphoribosyltransferase n=1 Tax=Acetobacterium wieringae TaxID=52694 RepID=A0A5D0WTT4_9FIRM|nr:MULTISPECIES: anthranilate phosphoribosyltransferase [Acetobacterium]TYC87599.1 anthranilate phosphoribosyltransferase [Acetobacterium wieringae]
MEKTISMKDYGQVITQLINKENLSKDDSKEMFMEILSDKQTAMQQGAFLAALSAKGATPAEVAGSFEAIYEVDTFKVEPVTEFPIVDNCGTGMDSFKTFNISTVASIIAAAGIPMAKHGSRALTSVCGTIDVLEALGIDMDSNVDLVKESIEKAGIGIFNGMSPEVHPVALGRVLSQISFGSVLNISASLANPALPQYGVRGVYSKEMLDFVPQIMAEIGYKRAIVVFGEVGDQAIDEASTLGTTHIAELKEDGSVEKYTFNPQDMLITPGIVDEIRTFNSVEESALCIVRLLKGKETKTREDIVALNAGLILYLRDKAPSIREGYEMALELIHNGAAWEKLKTWVNYQNRDGVKGLKILSALEKKVQG